MTEPQTAPYGAWRSPISAARIASGSRHLQEIALAGADTFWVESRPAEGGRYVLVRRTPDGRTEDQPPAPFNVRTRVHEYGGGAYALDGATRYFANFADQRLHHQASAAAPRPLTPDGYRYADLVVDRARERLIAVREDHTAPGQGPVNTLVAVPLEGGDPGRVLVSGNDFYSSPRLSPDGAQLAWLTWNHPNMPWDGTTLWVAPLGPDGALGPAERIAGGAEESIFQPEWSPDGTLFFVSDRSGWWNLYRRRADRVEPVCSRPAEFGLPQWVFRMSTYAFASAAQIVCAYIEQGTAHLATIDTATGALQPLDTPYTYIAEVRAAPGRAVVAAASPHETAAIVEIDLTTGRRTVLRRSIDFEIDPAYISVPRAVEFPTEDGLTAHAFYYPPTNPDFTGPPQERPPLLVKSHGGPTAATSAALNLAYQYWTSRGVAILDVNYGGSTGYGRAYRERLNGRWGIVDVDDCVNGARYLVERGDVDARRLWIDGGSAGGYTTLCALTFRDRFTAGASLFGVSDLEALATDTHKFESRYLDRLVGPYPERADLYRARSPIHFTERLSCPLILLQGLEDAIVPPSQAERMFAAVRAKGLPVAYLAFPGEQHGFRRAENIQRALEAELYFYARVFGFPLADPIPPVPIENL
jgi:dipeptidyl aminopeptidase/acylaminoacyl peptidase